VLEFTNHARRVLDERRIELAWVSRVVSKPNSTEADPVDFDLTHRLGVIAERDGAVLPVAVNLKTRPGRVVTAFFDRRMKGRL
jgi:hypothetical protein